MSLVNDDALLFEPHMSGVHVSQTATTQGSVMRTMATLKQRWILLFLSVLSLPCSGQPVVKVGADVLLEGHLDVVLGKRVGIITNHTGKTASGEFLTDALMARGIRVVKLFGPEHGIRGEAEAGKKLDDGKDVKTGLPVISLYGKNRKPTPGMLADVDVLLYDIQDVGARFYTYISTMILSMEAAAKAGITFVVLDRPNPLGGILVDGPILEDSLRSFVGIASIPTVYGLTCGELATLANQSGWLAENHFMTPRKDSALHARLIVIPMEGWKRNMPWHETGLTWTPPSPNIPSDTSALAYAATCYLEATNVSEGRGTARPFQIFGAPFVRAEELNTALNALHLPGAGFRPLDFIPSTSKFKGEVCHGVEMEIIDAGSFRPCMTGLSIIDALRKLYSAEFTVTRSSFQRLFGSSRDLTMLLDHRNPGDIESGWQGELLKYKSDISRYLLY